MRKITAILLAIPVLLSAGCKDRIDKSKIALDYGRVFSSDITSIDQLGTLSYDELCAEIDSNKNFVLLLSNPGCGCWEDFAIVAKDYFNEYHVDLKVMPGNIIPGDNEYGITAGPAYQGFMPSVVFFRDGKLVRQTVYGKLKENNRWIFKEYCNPSNPNRGFKAFMEKNVYLPTRMFYLNKETLNYKIANNDTFNLYIMRNGCGDCKALDTNILRKWSRDNKDTTVSDALYVFDIEQYRGTSDYQTIKDTYGLSTLNNPTFGFDVGEDKGFVPTLQRREGSVIKDMITVLNDQRQADADKVISYFNEARIAASPMLQSTGTTYLFDGMALEAAQFTPWGTVIQELQLAWHTPIVELFISTYIN